MNKILIDSATAMLIIGYMIHAINFGIIHVPKMSIAMVLFAAAMYFLFV